MECKSLITREIKNPRERRGFCAKKRKRAITIAELVVADEQHRQQTYVYGEFFS